MSDRERGEEELLVIRRTGISLVAMAFSALLFGPAPAVLGQPSEQVGPKAASYWTATLTPIDEFGTERSVPNHDGGEDRLTNGSTATIRASDDRISGDWTESSRQREYEWQVPIAPIAVWSSIIRIENEGGAWEGAATGFYAEPPAVFDQSAILHGEGTYEGLTALVRFHRDPGEEDTVDGVIVPGDLPPVPKSFRLRSR